MRDSRPGREPQPPAEPALLLSDAPAVGAPSEVEIPEGWAFRAVPLLEIVDAGEQWLVVVGQTRVLASPRGETTVQFLVRALWQARARTPQWRDEEGAFTAFVARRNAPSTGRTDGTCHELRAMSALFGTTTAGRSS
jgi:hypothetical protein